MASLAGHVQDTLIGSCQTARVRDSPADAGTEGRRRLPYLPCSVGTGKTGLQEMVVSRKRQGRHPHQVQEDDQVHGTVLRQRKVYVSSRFII